MSLMQTSPSPLYCTCRMYDRLPSVSFLEFFLLTLLFFLFPVFFTRWRVGLLCTRLVAYDRPCVSGLVFNHSASTGPITHLIPKIASLNFFFSCFFFTLPCLDSAARGGCANECLYLTLPFSVRRCRAVIVLAPCQPPSSSPIYKLSQIH